MARDQEQGSGEKPLRSVNLIKTFPSYYKLSSMGGVTPVASPIFSPLSQRNHRFFLNQDIGSGSEVQKNCRTRQSHCLVKTYNTLQGETLSPLVRGKVDMAKVPRSSDDAESRTALRGRFGIQLFVQHFLSQCPDPPATSQTL